MTGETAIRYGTSIGEASDRMRFEKGDVLQDDRGNEVIIHRRVVDVDSLIPSYRIEWIRSGRMEYKDQEQLDHMEVTANLGPEEVR